MANFKSLVNLTNDAKTVQVGERQKAVFLVAENGVAGDHTNFYEVMVDYYEKQFAFLKKGRELLIEGDLVVKKNVKDEITYTNITIYASKITFTNGTKQELPETQTSA